MAKQSILIIFLILFSFFQIHHQEQVIGIKLNDIKIDLNNLKSIIKNSTELKHLRFNYKQLK